MKKILLALSTIGFVSAVSFSACGSADSCNATSKCSADPVVTRTDAEIKACQTARDAVTTCKTEIDATSSCYINNQKCTADNKNDAVATLAACKTQVDAQTACLTKPVADAGTRSDGGTP